MKTITLSVLLASTTIALSACGGEPPPPHAKQGPNSEPASIVLSTADANGMGTNLQLNCGTGTPIEQCAKIARSLIDQANATTRPGTEHRPAPDLDRPD